MCSTLLSHLPGDVLFDILKYCDLKDILSFSLVCSIFHGFSQKRALWITALERTRSFQQPIARPFHDDLTKYTFNELKRVVLHTLRLQRNWELPLPKILGNIKTFMLPGKLDTVFQIPGTELYLMHSTAMGNIVCWDVGLEKPVSAVVDIGGMITDRFLVQTEYGRASTAAVVSGHDLLMCHLIIISVEYGSGNVDIQVTFRRECFSQLLYLSVFSNEDIVGVVRCDLTLDVPRIEIVAFNQFLEDRMAVVQTDIEFRQLQQEVAVSFLDNDMTIHTSDSASHLLYACSKDLLPYCWNTDLQIQRVLNCSQSYEALETTQSLEDEDASSLQQEAILGANPIYGVRAISVLSEIRDKPSVYIRFWTAGTVGNISPRNAGDHIVKVSGRLQDWPGWLAFLLSHSGTIVLLAMKEEERSFLQLVRYDPLISTSSIHRLDIPDTIDLSIVYGLSLDDHLGVVTVVDRRGCLFAIPYA
ncbi:hypothetical protein BDQ12DRAFT_42575 [Crucibulum laeve]|uniref:F-box domain-containing protein n=1 Tax=Crucibulum laeve TaxID=68775 RepID=A0A5C3MKM8_9AGAR|nr:hypothetical protein BDQ12DRAFT_42575 [Crucibulum laeve]